MDKIDKLVIGWLVAILAILCIAILMSGCSQQPVYVGIPESSYTGFSPTGSAVDSTLWQIHEDNVYREQMYRNIDTGNDNMIRMSDQLNRNHYETHETSGTRF